MTRAEKLRKIATHIKFEFKGSLDRKVHEDGVYNSAFWPGAYAETEHCPLRFEEAGVVVTSPSTTVGMVVRRLIEEAQREEQKSCS